MNPSTPEIFIQNKSVFPIIDMLDYSYKIFV